MNQYLDAIKNELEMNTEIKAVSFDVFDTLLFRSVVTPDRVIWHMYQKRPKAFPAFTAIGDWVSSRRTAEKEARRISKETCGHEEILLTDIYRCLPTVYSNVEELMQLELDCECELCVLNTEMAEIIQYLFTDCGKEIFLISDMYLNSEQISHILSACGLDMTLIKKCYVSSDLKCNKKNGELFRIVLDEQHLSQAELYHIGDNLQSDIIAARQLGIPTFHYDFISKRQFRYPFLLCEREFFGAPLCERLYLTRLLAGRENQDFFYTLGSMIIGPFLTCAIEWVIDTALKEKIHKIRPFMREGNFLTKMLLAAKENRGVDLSIEPLYISRLSAYSSRFSDITAKEISVLLAGARVTPKDVFHLLQIDDMISEFGQYSNIMFTKLKNVSSTQGSSMYDVIYDFLSSEKVINIIRERNSEKKELFLKYLQKMGLDESVITLDIGWNGTTMNAVYQTIQEETPDINLVQLLFCSSKNVAKNAVDGCVIKGFVGNYGGGQGKFDRIFIPIFELFCLCDEGPTIGYEYQGQTVVPIIDKNVYSEKWLSNIEVVQRGVMAFQKEYFAMRKSGKLQIDVKKVGIQALTMIERLFSQPYFEEVEQLRTAELDQNMGIEDRMIMILENDLCAKYQEIGSQQFYSYFQNLQKSIMWHQALPILNDPFIYLKMHYFQKNNYLKLATILLLEYAVQIGTIAIVIDGPTRATDLALMYLKIMGAIEKVAGIVSIKKHVCGVNYYGFSVASIEEDIPAESYFITVKDKIAYRLMRQEIIKEKGEEAIIVGYYENDLEALEDE